MAMVVVEAGRLRADSPGAVRFAGSSLAGILAGLHVELRRAPEPTLYFGTDASDETVAQHRLLLERIGNGLKECIAVDRQERPSGVHDDIELFVSEAERR
jgi:hypothetical protein